MPDTNIKKLAELVRSVVKEELKPVSKQVTGLTEQVTGLAQEVSSVTEQVSYLTEKVDGEIIPALEIHTKYLKKMAASQEKNDDNIGRLDKRLSETEASLGIQPPP